MSKDKPEETDEATEKGGGKKKLLVILAAVVLVTAGAAYFFVFSGSGEAQAEEPVSSGTFLTLEPVAVNLAGGGYLKIGITLQLTADAASGHSGGEVDGSKALDLVIASFSQANPADVTGARDALKEALEKKIVDAYMEDGHEIVMGIYYNEYVTQ
jgi:flagellar FliL protein